MTEINKNTSGVEYLDITIRNNQDRDIPAHISQERISPFIENIDQYYLSISKFKIDATAIPFFIFRIVEGAGQIDPNLGVYALTIGLGADIQTLNIEYIPTASSNVVPTPLPPSQRPFSGFTQDLNTTYYYVYSIKHMIYMMNQTFASIFVLLTGPTQAALVEPPYVKLNYDNSSISIITRYEYLTAGADIFYSFDLQRFFDGLDIVFEGYTTPNDRDVRLVQYFQDNAYVKNLPGVPFPNQPLYLEYRQPQNNSSLWPSIDRIFFTSTLIPIKNQVLSQPNADGILDNRPILEDFNLEINTVDRSTVNFSAQIDNYIELIADGNLSKLDLDAYWVDQLGSIYRILLSPGRKMSLKVKFTRKDLVTNPIGKKF